MNLKACLWLGGCLCAGAGTYVGSMSSTTSEVSPSVVASRVVREIDVIVLAGQSNALGYPNEPEGYGTTGDSLPLALQGEQVNIRSWNHTYSAWTNAPLRPDSSVYWGVELTAMDAIFNAYQRPMAMVKVAFGSTSLALHWSRGQTRYLQLSNAMVRAKATMESEGLTPRWRQFWWIQGESDATAETNAVAYAANFDQFWADLCADTGMATNTTVIIAPLPPQYNSNFAESVKSNQTWLAENRANIHLVDVTELPWYSGVHYSADSLMTLGERFAALYMAEFDPTPAWRPLVEGSYVVTEAP